MKRFLFVFIPLMCISLIVYTQTQEKVSRLNLGFEEIENGSAKYWQNFGSPDYTFYVDSINRKSGKYSHVIESPKEGDPNFKALAFTLPESYEGKEITLSGYIKTENVTDGYAGLWVRIDPEIAFDNMYNKGVAGTTDWNKYEIKLAMNPPKTQQIVIGGMLVGKGKMWLDDLSISIDGKDIADATIYERELKPAELDKEFDNGSIITFPELDDRLTDNLELLGRLWGFLKYHHPEVGRGNYNWDYELFRVLPEYLAAKNSMERDKVLVDWIMKYGKIPICTNCEPTNETAYIKPNLNWVADSDMSSDLKNMIKNIYSNRHQGEHFYIEMTPNVSNPIFNNENLYANMPYPDEGFRLLCLYKYWNMIKYFFPYAYVTDKNWDVVLREYIPEFISAEDELAYELVVLRIIGDVVDTHANLWGGGDKLAELRGEYYAPFKAEFVEDKLVITDYYNPELVNTQDLKIGDIITHINGRTTASIVDSLKIYYPASNDAARLRDISDDLLRSYKNNVQIKYISRGQELQQNLTLYPRKDLNIYRWYRVNKDEKCYKLLNDNIGYVSLANIKAEDVSEIKENFKTTKGIIIDVRNYPSAFVPFLLGSFFVSKDTEFVRFSFGNVDNPGEFSLSPALKIPKGEDTYQGKLIVLVNEKSQSQAEYTAMAFRAGANTIIVGSTTAGADGNISPINLPGGLRTMISGIGVYYPDGGKTQRIGIVPDVEIRPAIKGIQEGRDELLEKAIEIIQKN